MKDYEISSSGGGRVYRFDSADRNEQSRQGAGHWLEVTAGMYFLSDCLEALVLSFLGVAAGGHSVERLRVSRALSREFAGQPCGRLSDVLYCGLFNRSYRVGPGLAGLAGGAPGGAAGVYDSAEHDGAATVAGVACSSVTMQLMLVGTSLAV